VRVAGSLPVVKGSALALDAMASVRSPTQAREKLLVMRITWAAFFIEPRRMGS
jgi:hypothetical protein